MAVSAADLGASIYAELGASLWANTALGHFGDHPSLDDENLILLLG